MPKGGEAQRRAPLSHFSLLFRLKFSCRSSGESSNYELYCIQSSCHLNHLNLYPHVSMANTAFTEIYGRQYYQHHLGNVPTHGFTQVLQPKQCKVQVMSSKTLLNAEVPAGQESRMWGGGGRCEAQNGHTGTGVPPAVKRHG
ncbi:hypothetical protein E2C01_065122 [Portunus trituberculatus]|uniref:Uncharacterized protein n=1 Tax=Portunus trituberculatus TaxID=210409 RepID=A0A5B7HDN4_PORTR|nr:hypothetical protein [Portunus trituberculatus]